MRRCITDGSICTKFSAFFKGETFSAEKYLKMPLIFNQGHFISALKKGELYNRSGRNASLMLSRTLFYFGGERRLDFRRRSDIL